eukprot:GILK01001225.1.p1 GENE.GILK01001225.1~~GILK01001225.1.p1  ORF type:complete len:344 (-),score=51.82 GILK01001225.1:128-1159(-)
MESRQSAAIRRARVALRHVIPDQCSALHLHDADTTVFAPTPEWKYRYTVPGGAFTEEMREHYEQHGFVVVKHLLTVEEMDKYRVRFIEYCDKKLKPPVGMQVVKDVSLAKKKMTIEGQQGITKLQDFQEDEVLFDYCQHPDVVKYTKSICGEDVKSVHTMFINKPPNVGESGRHPLHQDLLYFPFRPADRIVCSWTAMEQAGRDNGCLVVIPGTHKGDMMEHGYPQWESGVNKAYWGVQQLPEKIDKRVHLEMEPGDTVFFHPLLIHGSGTNRTQGYRKSISCHYASAKCHYVDITGTYHAPLADEIMSYASKKFFAQAAVSYHDIWRFKSRLVAGRAYSDGL